MGARCNGSRFNGRSWDNDKLGGQVILDIVVGLGAFPACVPTWFAISLWDRGAWLWSRQKIITESIACEHVFD